MHLVSSTYCQNSVFAGKQHGNAVFARKRGLDYYPFGMLMPGRHYTTGSSSLAYRYGFNGKEKDNEVYGNGNSYDFGARILDPRIGRWLSVDPLAAKAPGWSPYRSFFDNPILFSDPDGNFEIPEALAAKHPNLKPMLQNIAAELQKPENADKLNAILKYGEFKDANQLISLFSDGNKSVRLEAGNLLAPNLQKDGLIGEQGVTRTSTHEMDEGTGMLKSTVTLDDNLFRLLGDEGLSKDGKDFANLLFESTLLHELIHVGDAQDGVRNSAEPLQYTQTGNNGVSSNLHNKEVGKYAEKVIYGQDVDVNNNKEVKQNVIKNKEKK